MTKQEMTTNHAGLTKQEIKEQILGCAAELGRVPSIFDVMKIKKITRRQIRKHYGSYSHALEDCNLERENSSGHRVPLDKLFLDWVKVVQQLGKAPSMSEYEAMSKYSIKPLIRCFGSWRQVTWGLAQYAAGSGLAEPWKAELALAAASGQDAEAQWTVQKEATKEANIANHYTTERANLRAAAVAGTNGVCSGKRAWRGLSVWRDGVGIRLLRASRAGGISRLRGDAPDER